MKIILPYVESSIKSLGIQRLLITECVQYTGASQYTHDILEAITRELARLHDLAGRLKLEAG